MSDMKPTYKFVKCDAPGCWCHDPEYKDMEYMNEGYCVECDNFSDMLVDDKCEVCGKKHEDQHRGPSKQSKKKRNR